MLIQISNFKFQILLLISLFTFNFALSTPVKAADSTPSADIRSKLEQLKTEIASKAAKLKLEINQKLQNKAYVGTVKTKSDNSLTLASLLGSNIISLNQDTTYEQFKKSSSKFSFKTLEQEDLVAALGDIDDTGVLTAKKVILLPSTSYQPKTILWGQVVANSDKLITIKDRDLKSEAVSMDSDTDLKKGIEEINSSDIKTGNFVIVSGYLNKQEILEATLVYVLPQGSILKPKTKISTSSAQPATPSSSVNKK